MLTDKGFSHALANFVLTVQPNDPEALKILEQPKNRMVYDDGTVVDLDKVNEEQAKREGLKRQLDRMTY